jgi:hypothetical protein
MEADDDSDIALRQFRQSCDGKLLQDWNTMYDFIDQLKFWQLHPI